MVPQVWFLEEGKCGSSPFQEEPQLRTCMWRPARIWDPNISVRSTGVHRVPKNNSNVYGTMPPKSLWIKPLRYSFLNLLDLKRQVKGPVGSHLWISDPSLSSLAELPENCAYIKIHKITITRIRKLPSFLSPAPSKSLLQEEILSVIGTAIHHEVTRSIILIIINLFFCPLRNKQGSSALIDTIATSFSSFRLLHISCNIMCSLWP